MTAAEVTFKEKYLARHAGRLAACESRLAAIASAPGGSLGESCSLTLKAGGKRLRPLLVFLAARDEGNNQASGDQLLAAAAAVELVHMATLVHDDVLDGAGLRRGIPTLFAKYGGGVSTAAGDYLFSSAFQTLSEAGAPEAISLLARTSLDLSQGELLQMRQAGDLSLTQQDYEQRCALKTGSLFAAACCLGALLSGCSDETFAALGHYGRCLGLAFQIADDILDFTGETGKTGKLVGTDLKDGTVNLPLIRALALDPSLGSICSRILDGPDDRLIDEACGIVKGSGALEQASAEAARCVSLAREALAGIDEVDTEPLSMIAEIAANRKV